jgi:hypothetical protein
MNNSRFIDDIFDTGSCQNYILSIQCSLNGFSFMIFDTISNKFIAHIEKEIVLATPYELKVELEKIFKLEAILTQSYKKVVISYLCLRSVLVPHFFSDKDDIDTLMAVTFEKASDEHTLGNDVIKGKSKLLFSVPGVVYRCLKEQYPISTFIAPSLPLLRYGLRTESNSLTLYIARFSDILIMLLVHEKKIHFLNQFYVKNETDCLYYILNTARQLNLDQKTELQLMGRIHQHSILVNSLRNYFEKVDFVPGDKRCSQSLTPHAGQEHYPIFQFELTLCE